LVNLYGDVALPLDSNYKKNSILKRAPRALVYRQIISDLTDAKSLLSPNYLDPTLMKITVERIRPTKWSAIALLARTYLFIGQYDSAVIEASAIINNTREFGLSSLNNVFLRAGLGNSEAIWQLQPVNTGWNTEVAKAFIIPSSGPASGYNMGTFISKSLLNAFEANDNRKASWTNSINIGGSTYFYPFKYKSDTAGSPVREYEMILRLGEQYLIRAEAEAHSDIAAAIADLNVIRERAGLGDYSGAGDQASVLNAIFHERQVELFCELGQRWLDLKRSGYIDSVMNVVTPLKSGSSWKTFQQLYPLPLSDIQLDGNLVQNPGY
jgi:hypothetical protein